MSKELIERDQLIADLHWLGGTIGSIDMEYIEAITKSHKIVEEAIAALSHPLPAGLSQAALSKIIAEQQARIAELEKPVLMDDAERWHDWLLLLKKHTESVHQKDCLQQSADLIERLAGENAEKELEIDAHINRHLEIEGKLQARIDELEGENE